MTGARASSDAWEGLLAEFLRSGRLPPAEAIGAEDPARAAAFLDAASAHRVAPLLHAAAGEDPAFLAWPEPLRTGLAARARAAAALDLRIAHDLRRVLAGLEEDGIPVLVLKGAALAHTVYASPAHRPRVDADLLVDTGDVAAAEARLAELGFRPGPRIRGRLVEYQAPWVRGETPGLRSVIDLHWRVSNRQSLAPRFPFEALRARAQPCPALGSGALVPDPVDALQIAAVHGPAHHGGQFHPLIWRFDLHLLMGSLGDAERRALVARSRHRRVARLVAASLGEAAARFGTRVPGALVAAAARGEPSAALLRRPGRRLLLHDFRHLPDLRTRLRWLREAAFPDTDYLRWRYAAEPDVSRRRLLLRRAASATARAAGWRPGPEG